MQCSSKCSCSLPFFFIALVQKMRNHATQLPSYRGIRVIQHVTCYSWRGHFYTDFCHQEEVHEDCSGTLVPPFFTSCMRRRFPLMRTSFVMLSTTLSDARARKGVSFYLSACRFPVFLYTNCTSVYLVWQIHFFSDLEMYYACGFVIKAMIICSSQMVFLDFGPALA